MILITTAFDTAARARARVLGMEAHPIVAMKHPLASRKQDEIAAIAESLVEPIVLGLLERR